MFRPAVFGTFHYLWLCYSSVFWVRNITKISHLNISCSDKTVSAKSSVTYWGMELDQTLSGETMGTTVVQKLNSRLKFLYRQSKFLTLSRRRTLVSALALSQFDCACSLWYYSLQKGTKDRIRVCQNKLIRFVLGRSHRAHLDVSDFKRVGWLPTEGGCGKLPWAMSLEYYTTCLHLICCLRMGE